MSSRQTLEQVLRSKDDFRYLSNVLKANVARRGFMTNRSIHSAISDVLTEVKRPRNAGESEKAKGNHDASKRSGGSSSAVDSNAKVLEDPVKTTMLVVLAISYYLNAHKGLVGANIMNIDNLVAAHTALSGVDLSSVGSGAGGSKKSGNNSNSNNTTGNPDNTNTASNSKQTQVQQPFVVSESLLESLANLLDEDRLVQNRPQLIAALMRCLLQCFTETAAGGNKIHKILPKLLNVFAEYGKHPLVMSSFCQGCEALLRPHTKQLKSLVTIRLRDILLSCSLSENPTTAQSAQNALVHLTWIYHIGNVGAVEGELLKAEQEKNQDLTDNTNGKTKSSLSKSVSISSKPLLEDLMHSLLGRDFASILKNGLLENAQKNDDLLIESAGVNNHGSPISGGQQKWTTSTTALETASRLLHQQDLIRGVRVLENVRKLVRFGGIHAKYSNERKGGNYGGSCQRQGFLINFPLKTFTGIIGDAFVSEVLKSRNLQKLLVGEKLAQVSGGDVAGCSSAENEIAVKSNADKIGLLDIFESAMETLGLVVSKTGSLLWASGAWLSDLLMMLVSSDIEFRIAFAQPIQAFLKIVSEALPSIFYKQETLMTYTKRCVLDILDHAWAARFTDTLTDLVDSTHLHGKVTTALHEVREMVREREEAIQDEEDRRTRAIQAESDRARKSSKKSSKKENKRRNMDRRDDNSDDSAAKRRKYDGENSNGLSKNTTKGYSPGDSASIAESSNLLSSMASSLNMLQCFATQQSTESAIAASAALYREAVSCYLDFWASLVEDKFPLLHGKQVALVHEHCLRILWIGLHSEGSDGSLRLSNNFAFNSSRNNSRGGRGNRRGGAGSGGNSNANAKNQFSLSNHLMSKTALIMVSESQERLLASDPNVCSAMLNIFAYSLGGCSGGVLSNTSISGGNGSTNSSLSLPARLDSVFAQPVLGMLDLLLRHDDRTLRIQASQLRASIATRPMRNSASSHSQNSSDNQRTARLPASFAGSYVEQVRLRLEEVKTELSASFDSVSAVVAASLEESVPAQLENAVTSSGMSDKVAISSGLEKKQEGVHQKKQESAASSSHHMEVETPAPVEKVVEVKQVSEEKKEQTANSPKHTASSSSAMEVEKSGVEKENVATRGKTDANTNSGAQNANSVKEAAPELAELKDDENSDDESSSEEENSEEALRRLEGEEKKTSGEKDKEAASAVQTAKKSNEVKDTILDKVDKLAEAASAAAQPSNANLNVVSSEVQGQSGSQQTEPDALQRAQALLATLAAEEKGRGGVEDEEDDASSEEEENSEEALRRLEGKEADSSVPSSGTTGAANSGNVATQNVASAAATPSLNANANSMNARNAMGNAIENSDEENSQELVEQSRNPDRDPTSSESGEDDEDDDGSSVTLTLDGDD